MLSNFVHLIFICLPHIINYNFSKATVRNIFIFIIINCYAVCDNVCLRDRKYLHLIVLLQMSEKSETKTPDDRREDTT